MSKKDMEKWDGTKELHIWKSLLVQQKVAQALNGT